MVNEFIIPFYQFPFRSVSVGRHWSSHPPHHDELLPWWRHQIETFSALLDLCEGNSPSPVNSPHTGQWCGALMFSLIYACTNGWVNTRCWWFETPSRPLWRHCNDKWNMGVVGTPIGASGWWHYNDIIMSAMASQIIRVSSAYPTVCSDVDQRKHQSSASLAFVREIHLWPVNSPPKGSLKREKFPVDGVTMWRYI